MAAYTAAYSDIRINDNARFRTQMGWFATQLETMGWAKQGDSGQIDWSSVAAPGAANTSQGYEIRKGTDNVYMKIEFGSGYAAYAKSLWFTFGTGTDGAGTITGAHCARFQANSATGYSGGSARAGDDFASGDGTRFMLSATDDTQPNYGFSVVFQRQNDKDLAEYTDAWWVVAFGYTTSPICNQYYLGARSSGSSAAASNGLGVLVLPRNVGDATHIPAAPAYLSDRFGPVPMRDVLVGAYSLNAHQSTLTVNGRTYLASFGNVTAANVWTVLLAYASTALVRYD